MKVRIGASAKRDIRAAAQFYETQSRGLGMYFRKHILVDIASLQSLAGIHATEHGFQRLIASKFPYVIFYELNRNTVKVVAVLDGRRDPDAIARRLQR